MKAKKNRTSSQGLFLAAVMGAAALLMLLLVVAFIKPESSPDTQANTADTGQSAEGTQGGNASDPRQPGETTDGSSVSEADSRSSDTGIEGEPQGSDGSDTAGNGQVEGNVADAGVSQPAESDTALQTESGDAQQVTGISQQDAAAQQGTGGQLPYTTSQDAGGSQLLPDASGQGTAGSQLLPDASGQGTSGYPQTATGNYQGDILPGTILPDDGSQGSIYPGGASGSGSVGQADYQNTQAAPTAILLSPDNYELVVATAYVNIRQLPSLDALILSVLAEGGAILRDDNTNGWSRVYYNGRTAYIYSQYLIPIR